VGRCVTNVNNAHRLEVYAVLALICGASATALNPVFVRLTDLDPSASAFHRMAWALPLMWGWAFIENRSQTKKAAAGSDRWALALCGLFFAGDLLALHWAIELTAVANAILFLNAQPIYVALGAWLLFGERVNAGLGVGIAVGITGAVVMLGSSVGFGGDRLLGDGLGIVAGLCYAGFILTASRLCSRLSSAVINAWTCAVAAPILLAAALLAGRTVVPGTPSDWMLMIALGVVSQAAGQGFIVWALAHLPTSFSAAALLSAPVAVALFAWVFLKEPVSTIQFGGMVLVLV
jgi:drug/metabolite transporter (DMT)-like permease